MKKLVSIISPCYNGAKYLSPFLESVLSQTYRPLELIFVDDASTDNTVELVESYRKKFCQADIVLKLLRQTVNQGQAAAINRGLKGVSGEYLMWIDSDDIMLPTNTEEKVQFLEQHPECGFVLAQGEIVEAGQLDHVKGIMKREKPAEKDDLFSDLIYENNVVFVPGTIMTRMSALREAIPTGQIFESREGQNWQLMLPLAYNFKAGYIEKPLFKCVEHFDSHSRTKRTCEQLINRQKNFQILLTETVDAIRQMPEDEKCSWKERIQIKCTRSMFIAAVRGGKQKLIVQYGKKLRELGEKPLCILWEKLEEKVKGHLA